NQRPWAGGSVRAFERESHRVAFGGVIGGGQAKAKRDALARHGGDDKAGVEFVEVEVLRIYILVADVPDLFRSRAVGGKVTSCDSKDRVHRQRAQGRIVVGVHDELGEVISPKIELESAT